MWCPQLPNCCSVLLIALYFLLGVAGFLLAMLGGAYLQYMKKCARIAASSAPSCRTRPRVRCEGTGANQRGSCAPAAR